MAENGHCMRLHRITWAGNAGQTPVSPPHAALPRPFHLTLTPFPEPLTHRLYSLRENKLRLKEKNYSLLDKRASSTHSAKNKTDGPPPLSPSLEERGEKLWRGQPIKGGAETAGDRCLLPQRCGESAWLAARSHTCCESFSQKWPQAGSSFMPSPRPQGETSRCGKLSATPSVSKPGWLSPLRAAASAPEGLSFCCSVPSSLIPTRAS